MAEGDSSDINIKKVAHKVKKVFKKTSKKKAKSNPQQGNQEKFYASGSFDDEVYSLGYDKKGLCIIFNHQEFDCGLDDRPDSEKDANALKYVFDQLEFDTKVYLDKSNEEIHDILKEAAERVDHGDAYGFVCCVMSHGRCINNQEMIYARDKCYPTEDLFTPFETCQSLAGKPKMFFIQACRGTRLDSGISVYFYKFVDSLFGSSTIQQTLLPTTQAASLDEERHLIHNETLCCKIPKKADFLIAYSSPKNHQSWKRHGKGSWFIQTLCATLKERVMNLDLLSILTIVNNRVAYCFESVVQDKERTEKKQVPSVYSTLTKRIQLFTSENISISVNGSEDSCENESVFASGEEQSCEDESVFASGSEECCEDESVFASGSEECCEDESVFASGGDESCEDESVSANGGDESFEDGRG